jgi:hypothetical protein
MHGTAGYTIGANDSPTGPCSDPTCEATGCATARVIAMTLCYHCKTYAGQGVHLVFTPAKIEGEVSRVALHVWHHACYVKRD